MAEKSNTVLIFQLGVGSIVAVTVAGIAFAALAPDESSLGFVQFISGQAIQYIGTSCAVAAPVKKMGDAYERSNRKE